MGRVSFDVHMVLARTDQHSTAAQEQSVARLHKFGGEGRLVRRGFEHELLYFTGIGVAECRMKFFKNGMGQGVPLPAVCEFKRILVPVIYPCWACSVFQ